ncbi:mitochondrial pyruvate carrier 2-like isoform X2 [Phymastichus coffea]|nr:mitochondrial pyruvate carrier 2-like isoform X2 [Phymastichus coffea]
MRTIGKFVPEKLQPLWKHPAGPQTIFFWAPAFKWGLVIAGLGDLQRPADKISISQSSALGLTGIIWTRYSLAIIPKNYSLFSVNLFVALTAVYQVARAIKYQTEQKSQTVPN